MFKCQQGRRGKPGTKGAEGRDGVKGDKVSSVLRESYVIQLNVI